MKNVIEKISTVSILTIMILITSCGGDSSNSVPEKRKSISEYEAKAVAEGQVETLLKSPSTAEFSGLRDTKISPITDGYNVAGYVDSQNGFGATIRSNYSVNIYLDTASGDIMYKDLNVK